MSLYILTSLGLIPVGNVLAGFVAERSSPTLALVGGGLITLAVALGVAIAVPELRNLKSGSAAIGAAPGRHGRAGRRGETFAAPVPREG